MPRRRAILKIVAVLAPIAAVFGCQSVESTRSRPMMNRPSMVFDAPPIRRLVEGTNQEDHPWYSYRNDRRLTTFAGRRGPVYERTVNVTIDRQTIHGDAIRDHYQNVTYRSTVSELVR